MNTMFIHITSIRVPEEKVVSLREMMATSCLPFARKQPGFVRGYFIEQVDDPEHAQLILVWESQAAFEKARGSEAMACIIKELHDLYSWDVRSDGYVAYVSPLDLTLVGEDLASMGS